MLKIIQGVIVISDSVICDIDYIMFEFGGCK